ncbi:hypothetical protein DL765_007410 [Monosporascus sp. GIB2]|nr:hypothetical protein DL765_007410 [Monosporascus sp. GIB2]
MCIIPARRRIGRPPSLINDDTSEQSVGLEESPEDANRIPDADGSMRSGSSVESVMSLPSDDALWDLASAPSVGTFTNMRSNSFSSPSPTLQLDPGELINDFTDTPANGICGAMGTNNPSSPRFATKLNRDFVGPSQSNYMPPIPLSIGGDVRMSHADPMPGEGAQRSKEEDINYIKQLCDIHAAIVQRPLYDECLTRQAQPQAQAASGARISELQLGRLFALTVQLKGMTGHALPIEGGGTAETPRQPLKNSATVLLALSCYARLDQIYSRAVDALREVHSSGQKVDDLYQLMSGLTVGGFSLCACQDFQLRFALAAMILDNRSSPGPCMSPLIETYGGDTPPSCTLTCADWAPATIEKVNNAKEQAVEQDPNSLWNRVNTRVLDAMDLNTIPDESLSHVLARRPQPREGLEELGGVTPAVGRGTEQSQQLEIILYVLKVILNGRVQVDVRIAGPVPAPDPAPDAASEPSTDGPCPALDRGKNAEKINTSNLVGSNNGEVDDANVMFKKGPKCSFRFWAIMGSLAMTGLLSAIEGTIITSALPTITQALGGRSFYIWVPSSYFLASIATLPLYAQISDIFGRRWPFLGAVVLFILGSGLCGGSHSMGMLVASRTIQGLGGDGIQLLVETAIAKLVPLRERGIFIALTMVAATAGAAIGPFIGGLIAEKSTWRRVFFLNLPIGGVLLALTLGGAVYEWNQYQIIVPLVVGFVGFGVFLAYEWTICKKPSFPRKVLANRTSAAAFLLTLIHSLCTYWSFYYLPIYFQSVKSLSPFTSGVDTLPIFAGIIPFAMIGGWLLAKWGRYKPLHLVGWVVMTVALGLLSLLDQYSSTAALMALTTGIRAFGRGFGSVWGVTIPSAVFNNECRLHAENTVDDPALVHNLSGGRAYEYATDAFLSIITDPTWRQQVIQVFSQALRTVWYVAVAFAGLGFLITLIEKEIKLRDKLETKYGIEEEKKAEQDASQERS